MKKTFKALGLTMCLMTVITFLLTGCPQDDDDNGDGNGNGGNTTTPAHVHDWGLGWVETTAPTCETAGVETRTCSLDADHKETRNGAAALGHNYGDSDWIETTEATYIAEGVETRTCSRDASHKDTRVSPQKAFTDIAALGTFLSTLDVNTKETPYTIKLNVANISTLRATLNSATNKYVYIDLSDSTITTIPNNTFYGTASPRGCATLAGITIPNTVTTIGDYAFHTCTNLASVTIPDSVTSIGLQAFYVSSLASVTIPNGVTSIGENAFSGCTSLAVINVESSNVYFASDNGVLYNKTKTSLILYPIGKTDASFTIPDSVTSIANMAFASTRLVSVTIPDSVTSIGEGAFGGCNNLSSITIPDSVTGIGDYVFTWCTSLASVTIPNSVTSIGENAFYACDSLTNVTIPNSVTSIGNSAFSSCTSLASVTIGNSVTSIGDAAFGSCESLTSVTIPNSVTSIGIYAFFDCPNLASVTFERNDTTTISSTSAFPGYLVTNSGGTGAQNRYGTWTRTLPDTVWTKQ